MSYCTAADILKEGDERGMRRAFFVTALLLEMEPCWPICSRWGRCLVGTGLLQETVAGLGDHATLHLIADADHAFHVPARTGRKDPEVLATALDTAATWMKTCD